VANTNEIYNANKFLDDVPFDLQDHIFEKMDEAAKLLTENEQIIKGALTELIASAQQAGNTQAADAFTAQLEAYETRKQQVDDFNKNWYDQVTNANDIAAIQFDLIQQIHGTSLIHQVTTPIDFIGLISKVSENRGEITGLVDDAKYPELEAIEPGRIPTMSPEQKTTAQAVLEARISTGAYDSYDTHQMIEATLTLMEGTADNYASIPDEFNTILGALHEDLEALFNQYGAIKETAFDLKQGDIATAAELEAGNDALSKLLEGQSKMIETLEQLMQQYPQLSLNPQLRYVIDDFKETMGNMQDNVTTNDQYIEAVSTLTKASLDNSGVQNTQPAVQAPGNSFG
jgi:chromosome segregation ATPase